MCDVPTIVYTLLQKNGHVRAWKANALKDTYMPDLRPSMGNLHISQSEVGDVEQVTDLALYAIKDLLKALGLKSSETVFDVESGLRDEPSEKVDTLLLDSDPSKPPFLTRVIYRYKRQSEKEFTGIGETPPETTRVRGGIPQKIPPEMYDYPGQCENCTLGPVESVCSLPAVIEAGGAAGMDEFRTPALLSEEEKWKHPLVKRNSPYVPNWPSPPASPLQCKKVLFGRDYMRTDGVHPLGPTPPASVSLTLNASELENALLAGKRSRPSLKDRLRGLGANDTYAQNQSELEASLANRRGNRPSLKDRLRGLGQEEDLSLPPPQPESSSRATIPRLQLPPSPPSEQEEEQEPQPDPKSFLTPAVLSSEEKWKHPLVNRQSPARHWRDVWPSPLQSKKKLFGPDSGNEEPAPLPATPPASSFQTPALLSSEEKWKHPLVKRNSPYVPNWPPSPPSPIQCRRSLFGKDLTRGEGVHPLPATPAPAVMAAVSNLDVALQENRRGNRPSLKDRMKNLRQDDY